MHAPRRPHIGGRRESGAVAGRPTKARCGRRRSDKYGKCRERPTSIAPMISTKWAAPRIFKRSRDPLGFWLVLETAKRWFSRNPRKRLSATGSSAPSALGVHQAELVARVGVNLWSLDQRAGSIDGDDEESASRILTKKPMAAKGERSRGVPCLQLIWIGTAYLCFHRRQPMTAEPTRPMAASTRLEGSGVNQRFPSGPVVMPKG